MADVRAKIARFQDKINYCDKMLLDKYFHAGNSMDIAISKSGPNHNQVRIIRNLQFPMSLLVYHSESSTADSGS